MSRVGQGRFGILLNFHLHGAILLPLDAGAVTAIPDLAEEASEVSICTATLLLEEGC